MTSTTNVLVLINCTWRENSASVGAAISLIQTDTGSFFNWEPPIPLLQRCIIVNNQAHGSSTLTASANDNAAKHVVQTGALHIEAMQVQLKYTVVFSENGIVAISSQIHVLPNTKVHFKQNKAINGGAISLLSSSVMELYNGSQVIFDANEAIEQGGAVYVTSAQATEFIFPCKCFFTHQNSAFPGRWNTSITFTNNTAVYGQHIYLDQLIPCGPVTNISAFQSDPFIYTEGFNFSLPTEISPGETININSVSLDEFEQYTPSFYRVYIEILHGNVSSRTSLSDNGMLTMRGFPESEFMLTSNKPVASSNTGRLGDCPLGLTLLDDTCICSARTRDKFLYGVTECDMSQF